MTPQRSLSPKTATPHPYPKRSKYPYSKNEVSNQYKHGKSEFSKKYEHLLRCIVVLLLRLLVLLLLW